MTDLIKCETLVAHNVTSYLSTLNNELLRCDMDTIDMNIFFAQWHTPKHIVIVKMY